MKNVSPKENFYDQIADSFDQIMNHYETDKRLNLIFNSFFSNENLKNKTLLDVGSGTGYFSQKAYSLGANVYSLDVGKSILSQVAKKCPSNLIVGSATKIPFKDNFFDYVICTEVAEHTTSPLKVISEVIRVTKSGGKIAFSVPNSLWLFSLWIANYLKIRPYHGNENWLSWKTVKKELSKNSDIKQMVGFNIVPWFHPILQPFITFFDRFGHSLGPFMVNIGVLAIKR